MNATRRTDRRISRAFLASRLRWALAAVLMIAAVASCGRPEQASVERTEAITALIDRPESRDWDKAVEDLVRIGPPAVEPLIAALERTERFIPGRASIALARIGTRNAIEVVYEAYAMPNIQFKSDIMDALGALGTARAEDMLVRVVVDKNAGTLWYAAARALGENPSAKAIEAVATLFESKAWYNRVAAVQALGRSKSPEAVPVILKTLGDESRVVQIEARKALASIGRPAIGPLEEALATAGEEAFLRK